MYPPLGSRPPSGTAVLPMETVTPQYRELEVDQSAEPFPTMPWQLVRVDRQENWVYLSASTTGCSHPRKVRVTESGTSIRITVTGTGGSEPCSMQYETLIGYVQLGSIATGKSPAAPADIPTRARLARKRGSPR